MSLAEDLLKRLDRMERKQAILEARGSLAGVVSAQLASTNTVVDIARDERTTSGTAAAGIGLGRVFFLPDASGNLEEAANIDVQLTNATHGAEVGKMLLGVRGANVLTLTAGKASAAQLESSVAIGTPPLVAISTTMVSNLNADLLDGYHAADIIAGAPAPHAILGTSHSDTTAGTVLRGDLITGQGVTAAWARLGKGSAGAFVRTDGTDVLWSTGLLAITAGKTLTATESLTLNALPVGGLAVATAANTLGSLAVGLTTQVLVGGGAGVVPAWSADLPTAVTIGAAYIYRAGGTDVAVADGGTGQSTANAGFNALSPMSALGDVIYGGASGAGTQLAGQITTTRKFLRQTGTGTVSAAPGWDTLLAADIPASALTKTDDTNITIALGGVPTTALLAATSLTLGWAGTLAAARLNANVVQAITNDTNITGSIATQTLTLGWTGTLAFSRLVAGTDADQIIATGATPFTPAYRLISTLAGAGLTCAAGVLAVGSTTLTVGADAVDLPTPGTLTVATANAAAAPHTHTITSSANPGAAASLLASTAAGGLTLVNLGLTGALDVVGATTLHNDLTVGTNIFFVDFSGTNIGINKAPDPQFDLDVLGNTRTGGYFVGKHAIQLPGALMICHYDGAPPNETNYTGNPTGHRGQVATVSGGVIYRPGKFGKAVQCAEATTNTIKNPILGNASKSDWTDAGAVTVYSTDFAVFGAGCVKYTTGGYCNIAYDQVPANTETWICSFYARNAAGTDPSALISLIWIDNGAASTWTATACSHLPGWYYVVSAPRTIATSYSVLQLNCEVGLYVDGVQVEQKAYATPLCAGSLGAGHSWGGAANASKSLRTATTFTYPQEGNLDAKFGIGTVSAWFYVIETANIHYIVGNTGGGDYFGVYTNTNGYLVGRWGSGILTGTVVVTARVWHHAAMVSDGTTMTLYLDGTACGSGAVGTHSTIANIGVGYESYAGTQHINGYIDDLVILDRAATAAEVRAIYESNAPVFAETSTWAWRTPKTTLWTDAEGLWALDSVNGNQVLGFSTVNAKSWGGVTLDSGDFMLGRAAASVNNLFWDASTGVLALRNNTTARVSLAADGSGYLANSLISWDTAGNLTVAGNASIAGWSITSTDIRNAAASVMLRGAGNLAFGATPPTASNAGTGTFQDSTGFYGLAAGVKQFYLDATTGAAMVGAGNVTLDANGMLINLAVVGAPNTIHWGAYDAIPGIHLAGQMVSTNNTLLYIGARAAATYPATITLSAYSNTGTIAALHVVSDSNAAIPAYIQATVPMFIDLGLNIGTASGAAAGGIHMSGGLHVGGTSDPGNKNLLVDGETSTATLKVATYAVTVPAAGTVALLGTANNFSVTQYLGDTSNAKMTLGLTLNQGAADDEILALKSSDVGHALTTLTEADTFCEFHKAGITTGGVVMAGYKATGASSNAMALVGYLTDAADTGKLTTASGVISLLSRLNNAGSYTDIGTDGNLVVMKNNNTTQFIFDAEGSAHANVEWTTFDKHNDVALLDNLEVAMQDGMGNGFGEFLTGHKRDLEKLNIAHFDDKPGHAMVNFTRLSMLLVGAIRQQAARIDMMEQRLLTA